MKKEINYKRHGVMYRSIECPTCGNEIIVTNSQEPQKCKWCRRLLQVKVIKKGRKYFFETEPVEFDGEYENNKEKYKSTPKKRWTYTDRFF